MIFSHLALLALTITPQVVKSLEDGKGLFSYNPVADNGPLLWPTLATDDENQCAGNRQSPIPLTANRLCTMQNADYTFNAGTCAHESLDYFNNDHSVEFEYPEEGCERNSFSMPDIDGVYELSQCHTHTGSEHTVEGFYANFELHCVHKLVSGTGTKQTGSIPDTNTQAVFGMFILVKGTEDNAAFQPLLDNWQAYQDGVEGACGATPNATTAPEAPANRTLLQDTSSRRLQAFNVYDLVAPTGFHHYAGSLTTPPCTEDIWWNVANDPVILSVAQGQQLAMLILGYLDENCEQATGANPFNGFTSRPPQDIFGRTVGFNCLGTGETAAPTSPPEAAPTAAPEAAPTPAPTSHATGTGAIGALAAVAVTTIMIMSASSLLSFQ